MIYKYPQEVHDLVQEWAPKMRDQELAAKCNAELGTEFTAASMKSFRGNHGYRNGMKKQLSKEEYWKYQTKWPQGMYEFIKENSWGVASKEMDDMVNEKFGTDFTPSQMKSFRQRHGIKSGVTGWFQRGRAPGTKGKTIEEICKHDPEKLAKVKATQFKKGHKPKNEMPVGTIAVTVDGYLIRKRQATGTQWKRWEFLHRAVWEEHNGPIPDGMIVTFKDGNKQNCDIDNLMLITRGEHASLVKLGLRSQDPDLTEAGLNLIRLKNAVKDARKK